MLARQLLVLAAEPTDKLVLGSTRVPRSSKRRHSLFAAIGLAHLLALAAGALERPLPALLIAGERLLHDAADDFAVMQHRVVVGVRRHVRVRNASGFRDEIAAH